MYNYQWIDRLEREYDYADDDTPYTLVESSCISGALAEFLRYDCSGAWAEKGNKVDEIVNEKIIPALREIYDIINEPCWIDKSLDD